MSGWTSAPEFMDEVEEVRDRRMLAEHERRMAAARVAGTDERRSHLRAIAVEKKLARGGKTFQFEDDLVELYLIELRSGTTPVEAADLIGTNLRAIHRYAQRHESFAADMSDALMTRFDGPLPAHAATRVVVRHGKFYGHCACGWRSQGRKTRALAIEAVREHAGS